MEQTVADSEYFNYKRRESARARRLAAVFPHVTPMHLFESLWRGYAYARRRRDVPKRRRAMLASGFSEGGVAIHWGAPPSFDEQRLDFSRNAAGAARGYA